VKLLVNQHMLIPGSDQLGISSKPEIGCGGKIQDNHESDRGHYQLPPPLQPEVGEQQCRCYLDGDRQRQQDARRQALITNSESDAAQKQRGNKELCITVVQRHHIILGHSQQGQDQRPNSNPPSPEDLTQRNTI